MGLPVARPVDNTEEISRGCKKYKRVKFFYSTDVRFAMQIPLILHFLRENPRESKSKIFKLK
jgi:hypothetical protein